MGALSPIVMMLLMFGVFYFILIRPQVKRQRETQEMLDFCGERGIVADIEMIRIQQINEAHERVLKGDVKYRFVIDMASLK